ncbi:type IV secretion system protein [Patescibacteria group bacterium]|nr:type IV secretion system protein [Patescibacteria group bacterium]
MKKKDSKIKPLKAILVLVLIFGFLFLLLPRGVIQAQQTLDDLCVIGILSIGNLLTGICIAKGIAWVGYILLFLISKILSVTGIFFNEVIEIVLKPDMYNIPALKNTWATSRDTANLFFIFVLLTIAIATILRIETYGAKKLLPKLIIAALFINFSFLITQYVILSSNLLAGFFLDGLKGQGGVAASISEKVLKDVNPLNIFKLPAVSNVEEAEKEIERLKQRRKAVSGVGGVPGQRKLVCTTTSGTITVAECLDSIDKKITTLETTKKGLSEQGASPSTLNIFLGVFVTTVFGMIIFFVAAFVFAAGAILLLTRMVILWILLVLSPFAFLFMILPKTASYAQKWWDTLFSQALFPVAFYFLFSLALTMLGSRKIKETYGQISPGNELNIATMILFFSTQIILFILALVVAKELSAMGSGAMISGGKAAAKWARGATVEASSRISKRALGGASAAALKSRPAEWISKIPLARQALRPLAAGARVAEKQASEDAKRLSGLSIREQSRLIPTLSARAQAFAFRDMKDQDAGKLMKEMSSGERQRFGKRMKGFNEELGRKAAGATGSMKEATTILYNAPSKPPPKNTTQGEEYQQNLNKLFKELKADQLGGFDLKKELEDKALSEYTPEALFKGLNKENISGITKNIKNADALRDMVRKEAKDHDMMDENENIKFDEFTRHIRGGAYRNNSLAEYFQSTPARRFYGGGGITEEKKEEKKSPEEPGSYHFTD